MSADAGSVRRWFRAMRTADTAVNLERFLTEGNDGAGHVYLAHPHLPDGWMNAEGWARYQSNRRLARTFNELTRAPGTMGRLIH